MRSFWVPGIFQKKVAQKFKGNSQIFWLSILCLFVLSALLLLRKSRWPYVPSERKILETRKRKFPPHDLWPKETSFSTGLIEIDAPLIERGREAFYGESFGNETFTTDVVGIFDGPISRASFVEALLRLGGRGTTNLQITLSEDTLVGGRAFRKGELIDTGLDVPRGAFAPLGMPVILKNGRALVGVACAACHARVDEVSGKIVEGAPNLDLNMGLLLALSSNSTSYLTHTERDVLLAVPRDKERIIKNRDGSLSVLPYPEILEDAVDRVLLKWPPGYFDSTLDFVSNPTKIPASFTWNAFPYSYSGFALAGPFRGLSVFSNNVHGQNIDTLSQTELSQPLFDIPPEEYLATLLQNAPRKFRFDAKKGKDPREFFKGVDPTPGTPGVASIVVPPTFPSVLLTSPTGLYVSLQGENFWYSVNAMAAWQNTLVPAPKKEITDLIQLRYASQESFIKKGEFLFKKARCIACHVGPAFTNNKIISARQIGTEGTRAVAFKKAKKVFSKSSLLFSFDSRFEGDSSKLSPVALEDAIYPKDQIEKGWGFDSQGGYKVPSLLGLAWRSPYLHDGGVAVGKADTRESLRALIDRRLRSQVVASNKKDPVLRSLHITGQGHEFWADSGSGFSAKDQEWLIDYLLSLEAL